MKELIEDFPGWKGSISHLDAEELLIDRESGTYLLREEDPITYSVKEKLQEENRAKLACYILTVVEDSKKIEDILLIKLKDKWMLYHDDPDLINDPNEHFDSLKDLLSSLKDKVKYPL